jgi:hypothetical protein
MKLLRRLTPLSIERQLQVSDLPMDTPRVITPAQLEAVAYAKKIWHVQLTRLRRNIIRSAQS